MMIEWECILDCNYQCPYCVNSRNSALPIPILYEKDKQKVFKFLDSIKEKYTNDELFVFGGEPFLHPFINEIIDYLNHIQMKFVIQSNFSCYESIKKCNNFQVQVSIHPTEIKDLNKFIANLKLFKNNIRKIDVMYMGDVSIQIYKELVKTFKDKIFIAPVADFKITNTVNKYLYEFNELKQSIYGRIFKFEPGERSFIWEEQQRGKNSLKGKTCIYKDNYILFDPMLNSYTCSYRENNIICPNDQCFFM